MNYLSYSLQHEYVYVLNSIISYDNCVRLEHMETVCCCRHSGTQSIACSYKAVTGYLYPLERGFIFVNKPPVHIRFDEVESVNFARSAGNTRSFDFDISTVTGSTYTFVGIEK